VTLPICLGKSAFYLLPEVFEVAAHDDQILPNPLTVSDVFGNEELVTKAKT
jgi:hypothetical protein